MNELPSILLVGGGKMGSALLSGWITSKVMPEKITVVEPNPSPVFLRRMKGISLVSSPSDLPCNYSPDAIIFAVKPQIIPSVVGSYTKYLCNSMAISVAAGVTIEQLEVLIGRHSIVRAMPNTPAAIGRGITAAFSNDKVNTSQKRLCEQLLKVTGKMVWIENESYMDAITAVSGSGPAYVFLLIECLTKAGIAAGLPNNLSSQLAESTIAGAAELAIKTNESPATLRENVTSPGGTTAAALKILMNPDGMPSLLERAVAAATARSKELAKK
jgi:pyrroline-5-carboxylate reductase